MSKRATIAGSAEPPDRSRQLPSWAAWLLPLLALGLLLSVFAFTDPLALFKSSVPPAPALTIERVQVVDDGFQLTVFNGGPQPVRVAQVQVDDAYWNYTIKPAGEVPPLGRANVHVEYPYVVGDPHQLRVVTATGATFEADVELAVPAPALGPRQFLAYGLLGVYVGVLPVVLGMLWFPAMRRAGRKWMGAVLALTLGLLVFLLIDTGIEALDVSRELPGVFQGQAMVLFAALLTWLVLLAIGGRQGERSGAGLAAMIALGIGVHNLGEGLAIGAAFSLGEAALGSFLVIGFTLHNITEGIGIAAPLLPQLNQDDGRSAPPLTTFLGLALLAGGPAIAGTWIGGFAFSPVLSALFLGVGAGAIWQVIVEVWRLLVRYAEREAAPAISWANVAGFVVGLAVMYFTAFLVAG